MADPGSFDAQCREALRALAADGLRRRVRTLDGPGPRVRLDDGTVLLAFASNDVLGLAGDPRLAAALAAGASSEGAGAGAARLVTGARPSHAALESDVVAFKGCADALLVGSGYAANVALFAALAGPGDRIVSDALNHASLIDGCRLSRADVTVVPHADVDAVRRALAAPARRRFVVTEGLFSMDGDVPDLAALAAVAAEAGALLIVDDAHGHGVLGPDGRGALAAAGVVPGPGVLEVGTFGKAFGGYGAFVAGTAAVVDLLRHRHRGFVFSTALPPGVAALDREGLRIARAEPERRTRTLALADRLRAALRAAGLTVPAGSRAHIVPVLLGDPDTAVSVSDALLREGFFVPAIRPPTVPDGTSRLRVTVSAGHEEADVEALAAAVAVAVPAGTRA